MKPSITTAGSSSSSSSSRATEIKSEWGEKEIKEENMKEREEIRKHAMDPMCGLLKSENKIRKIDGRKMIIKDELNSHYTKVAVKEERDSSSNGHRNKRAREKEFEESYDRDRHHRGGPSGNHHRLSDASGSSSSSSARDGSRSEKKERQDYKGKIAEVEDEKISKSTALMRLKRIEREYIERKRAALVLAKADIYGAPLDVVGVSNLPDGRAQRYHQQFHPHIAR